VFHHFISVYIRLSPPNSGVVACAQLGSIGSNAVFRIAALCIYCLSLSHL